MRKIDAKHPLDMQSDKSLSAELPGFHGEQSDPENGVYHLGNGYRAYSPTVEPSRPF